MGTQIPVITENPFSQIPVIPEKPLSDCGWKKFQLDALGDHLCTCTTHLVVKKTHDWTVVQIVDLFSTTHKAKSQQVVRSRGHQCGDIELVGYLTNTEGPVPLVLDLRITHDRFRSSSEPSISGRFRYPNDIDRSLNEDVTDKIRKYRTDYNNNPPNVIPFMTSITSTSERIHSEFVLLLFLQSRGVLLTTQVKDWEHSH